MKPVHWRFWLFALNCKPNQVNIVLFYTKYTDCLNFIFLNFFKLLCSCVLSILFLYVMSLWRRWNKSSCPSLLDALKKWIWLHGMCISKTERSPKLHLSQTCLCGHLRLRTRNTSLVYGLLWLPESCTIHLQLPWNRSCKMAICNRTSYNTLCLITG